MIPDVWTRAQKQYDKVMVAKQNCIGVSYWCYYEQDVLEETAIIMIQNDGCKVKRVSTREHPHKYLITWEVGRGGL